MRARKASISSTGLFVMKRGFKNSGLSLVKKPVENKGPVVGRIMKLYGSPLLTVPTHGPPAVPPPPVPPPLEDEEHAVNNK